ncbi:T9SS type A sorting domain-containing protein [Flavobacterium rhizosphaerae]|uniref:T9SS type A sorting domain-containing protein n=1 Tax=Flavobacterium rhizosphaerae TaxID=3163298 RepID=A0ABW8YR83_9FLAO
MKRIVLSAIIAFSALTTKAQCDAVETINEDFSDFTITTTDAFPQNCWSTIATGFPTGVLIYTAQDGDPANQYANFYAAMGANVAGYLVTPPVSTIDGNHHLTFSSWKLGQEGSIPAGTVTVQVGTMVNPADAATFTAYGDVVTLTSEEGATTFEPVNTDIILPSDAVGTHIAFKIISDTNHNAIAIDNIVWEELPTVCEAMETLDENFDSFESDDLPQNCWSGFSEGPFINFDNADESTDRYLSFYSFTFVDTPAYFVTPELSTINGNYSLTFDAGLQAASAPGIATIQPGTLTNPANAATFTPVGDAVTVSTSTVTSYSVPFPQSTNAYVAFKISASGQHVAAILDNVKWQTTAGSNDVNKALSFSIYPNPSDDKNITVSYNSGQNATVNIYSITGARVFTAQMQSNMQAINLSSLNAGIYIVTLTTGNATATQKLIVK